MRFTILAMTVLIGGCAAQPATLDAGSPAEGYDIETTGTNHRIVRLTSSVYEVKAAKDEIIAKAQACVGRTFSYGAVKATGSNAPLFGTDQQSIAIGGGQLIEVADDPSIWFREGGLTGQSNCHLLPVLVYEKANEPRVDVRRLRGGPRAFFSAAQRERHAFEIGALNVLART